MNETEKIMMDVMAELALAEAPIIFKGAMNLKLALAEQAHIAVSRITHDIDGDWMNPHISAQQMRGVLETAVRKVDPTLSMQVYREVSDSTSAGFWILNEENDRVFKMDLGIRSHPFYQNYMIRYKGKPLFIQGATITKMLADKICAISSPKVFRRAKDLVDTYILSHSAGYDVSEVNHLANVDGHTLDAFHEFRTRKEDLQHAYDKLRTVENKPNFDVLYARLQDFLKPFIERGNRTCMWNGTEWTEAQHVQMCSYGRSR